MWRSALEEALQEIGLSTMMAYPNVWIRASMIPVGYKYYEMLHVYVDDIMRISHLGDMVAKQIGNYYKNKKGSQGPPTRYLGTYT